MLINKSIFPLLITLSLLTYDPSLQPVLSPYIYIDSNSSVASSGYRCFKTLPSIFFYVFTPLFPWFNNHVPRNEAKYSVYFWYWDTYVTFHAPDSYLFVTERIISPYLCLWFIISPSLLVSLVPQWVFHCYYEDPVYI